MTAMVRVRAEGVSKTFGSARVLRNVSLEVSAGEIHALLGANGSGKSTFVKCLSGVQAADPGGRIEIGGKEVPRHFSTTDASEMGVRVVHQESPLIDSLTLAETFGHHYGFPTRGGMIRTRQLRRDTTSLLERLGVSISADTLAGDLSAPERAMVTLALALGDPEEHGSRLIILDEPTASMTSNDAERFLEAVKAAASHGAGVLLVTHRLGEVFDICDNLTILRGGEKVFQSATADTDSSQVIDEIVGPTENETRAEHRAELPDRFVGRGLSAEPAKDGTPVMEVKGLAGEILEEASFSLYPGEILGISGILGSGAEELAQLIAGAAKPTAGTISVGPNQLDPRKGPAGAIAAGVAYVPGDRLREGGIPNLTVMENMTLPNLPYYTFRSARQRADFSEVVDALDVRPPDPDRIFETLSGGNQQKVIVGKWALMRPRIFVLDNPTAGVDPGAREDILGVIDGIAATGTGIIVVSSEPEQLARIATRVLIMRAGRIADEMVGEQVDERAIAGASW